MEERIGVLARRGARCRRAGEFRKAANAYGELTAVEPEVARWWVLLGTMQLELRRFEDASKAFRQALWLFRRAQHSARVESLMGWLQQCASNVVLAA